MVQIGCCGGEITIRQVGNVSLPFAITAILWNRRVVSELFGEQPVPTRTKVSVGMYARCVRAIDRAHAPRV